jgi:hypothetical protein
VFDNLENPIFDHKLWLFAMDVFNHLKFVESSSSSKNAASTSFPEIPTHDILNPPKIEDIPLFDGMDKKANSADPHHTHGGGPPVSAVDFILKKVLSFGNVEHSIQIFELYGDTLLKYFNQSSK